MTIIAVGVVILLVYFKLKPSWDRFVLYFNSINWKLVFAVLAIAIICILIIYFIIKKTLEKRKIEIQSAYWADFELRAPARELETYLKNEPDPYSNANKLKAEMEYRKSVV